MLDGREFHRFVPEYRKVLLKYSLFGCGTCKLFKPQGQFSLILLWKSQFWQFVNNLKRTFLYSGTNLWNSLPSNIKSLNNEICFKPK